MTIEPGVIVTFLAAILLLCGTLFGILFNRVSKLEDRVNAAEGLVTKLREWALKHLALYYRHRQEGSPDPDPIPEMD